MKMFKRRKRIEIDMFFKKIFIKGEINEFGFNFNTGRLSGVNIYSSKEKKSGKSKRHSKKISGKCSICGGSNKTTSGKKFSCP